MNSSVTEPSGAIRDCGANPNAVKSHIACTVTKGTVTTGVVSSGEPERGDVTYSLHGSVGRLTIRIVCMLCAASPIRIPKN